MTAAAPSASAAPGRGTALAVHLDFYGVRATVRSPQAAVVEEFRRDFSWFTSAEAEGIDLAFHLQPPPAGAAAGLAPGRVGSSRVDLQACKLEYSIVSPK